MRPVNWLLRWPLLFWHRWISPALPPTCRFWPTCSMYAVEALDHYPLHRALWLILRRLARCHPFHAGGFDPLPLDPPQDADERPSEDQDPR